LYFCVQALIDGKVLCVHGGLSPDIRTLDQVSQGHTVLVAAALWLRCLVGWFAYAVHALPGRAVLFLDVDVFARGLLVRANC
jgi:hypothetical protein